MSTTVVYASGESGYIRQFDATYLNAARGDGTPTAYPSDANIYVGQHFNTPTISSIRAL